MFFDSMILSDLIRHRYWMKGPSHDGLITGWVQEVDGTELTLSLSMNDEVVTAPNQVFICSISSPIGNTQFRCRVLHRQGESLRVLIESGIHLAESKEGARTLLNGSVIVHYQGEQIMAELVDVSARGMGIRAPFAFPPSTKVSCSLDVKGSKVEISATVMYSHQEAGGNFRSGLRLASLDRLTAAWWSRLTSDGAEAMRREDEEAS